MSSIPPETRQRLFFALWPDTPVRRALAAAGTALLDVRHQQVPVTNLHMTLAFAGSVPAAVAQCLAAEAATLRSPPFEMLIDHGGHWRKPRIAWIGPSHTPAELLQLVAALRRLFGRCGLPAETRAYQPHITLARKVSVPQEAELHTPIRWSIRSFSLIESVAGSRGVEYRPLLHWPLEG